MIISMEYLEDQFDLPDFDLKQYSPLTLAYLGDAVYEIVIRTVLVRRKNAPANKLHHQASALVKAEKQAEIAEKIGPLLTDEESSVLRRGRNAKSHTKAKNASVADYRMATGLETLTGYLYLQGKTERIVDLIKAGLGEEL